MCVLTSAMCVALGEVVSFWKNELQQHHHETHGNDDIHDDKTGDAGCSTTTKVRNAFPNQSRVYSSSVVSTDAYRHATKAA